jgi:hypothetical protein
MSGIPIEHNVWKITDLNDRSLRGEPASGVTPSSSKAPIFAPSWTRAPSDPSSNVVNIDYSSRSADSPVLDADIRRKDFEFRAHHPYFSNAPSRFLPLEPHQSTSGMSFNAGVQQNAFEEWRMHQITSFHPSSRPGCKSMSSTAVVPLSFCSLSKLTVRLPGLPLIQRGPPASPNTLFDPSFAPGLPISTNAIPILTDRNAAPKRHYRIIQVHAAEPKGTNFLLYDSTNSGLFHGTIDANIRHFDHYLDTGIWLTDFKLGNEPILPVAADYFFPTYNKCTMTRYTGALDATVLVKMESVFKHEEFKRNSYAYRDRLANHIELCESLVPSRRGTYLAQYLGVVVNSFSRVERVEAIVFKRYTINLYDLVEIRGGLHPLDIEPIARAVNRAVRHLHSSGIVHGNVQARHIFLTLGDSRKMIPDMLESSGESCKEKRKRKVGEGCIEYKGIEDVALGYDDASRVDTVGIDGFIHGVVDDTFAVSRLESWLLEALRKSW